MSTASTSPRTRIEEVTLTPRRIAGLRERVAVTEFAAFFARAVPAAAAGLAAAGVAPDGPPTAAYRNEQGQTFEVTVGFPVSRMPGTGALVEMDLPGGPAVQGVHLGPYETLAETYSAVGEWFAARHLPPPAVMWEEYMVGPDAAGEAGCVTRVVFPVQ